jgi:hypothetical protein
MDVRFPLQIGILDFGGFRRTNPNGGQKVVKRIAELSEPKVFTKIKTHRSGLAGAPTPTGPRSRLAKSRDPISQINTLAGGQITEVDTLTIELVEVDEIPAVVRIRWPVKPPSSTRDAFLTPRPSSSACSTRCRPGWPASRRAAAVTGR